MRKDRTMKQKYIDIYNRRMEELLVECDGDMDTVTELFEETATVDEVVGYYIVWHEEYALSDWLDNIDGIELTEQDKEVDRKLKELYAH